MDAKTLFNLIKPHLETMEITEKRSFTQLLSGSRPGRRRKVLSLDRAKEKLRLFRSRAIQRERT